MKPRLLGLALLCGASAGALADAEHDRITSARAAANVTLTAQERECATRFIVASCVEEARTAHRETLRKLRQQELQLDEGRRRAAAEARRNAIADKAQAQQGRASDAVPEAPTVRTRRAPSAQPAGPNPDAVPHAPAASEAGGSRRAVEQRNQARFEAGQRGDQAHRDAVVRRNAERAANGKVAAPLPASGGSAPR